MKRNIYKITLCLMLSFLAFSCTEEDLDPTLSQNKDIETNITSVGDLEALLKGAYNRMSISTYYGRDVIIFDEVRSDNAYSNANSNRFVNVAEMNLTIEAAYASDTWQQIYATIASANIIIGAEVSSDDAAEQQMINHITGQAYAIRALAHFDLLTLYGQQNVDGGDMSSLGVPYVVTFKDGENLFPPRNSVQEVKDLAVSDLETANSLMSVALNDPGKQYITTYAVDGIMARIGLYFEDWDLAESAAGRVVMSSKFEVAAKDDFIGTFNVDSAPNSVFEIANSDVDNQGIDGLANIYQDTNYGDIAVLEDLVNIYETGDVRGLGGIITEDGDGAYRNTGKYPSIGVFEDNVSIIRYEEVVLIYAEALLENGSSEALTYLNMIPENRGATAYTAATKENILLERRKELAFEGFRFDDLARTGSDIPLVDPILQTHGGPSYGSYNYAFPIPSAEVLANSNIVQNTGY
ncbi:RagB/SusD family nutrient uptake outer membrane protein [Joostella atrarenae]|uniref:RagB/SusD family nutrient uptake outer membrane protein n=1 Tax=Joostella atrarenae TaxID=679257 RepID=A0ABS9J664_9FLAO|nr:RagB/SusD family nutrient uptake outer membrane protein [Joostella atrarenae]MCF8715898.1 RagB/SusD family nutrient uptake outer membrane protein [Joostella atrarenae]